MIYDPKTNIVFWDELLKIPEFKALSETPQNILWHKEETLSPILIWLQNVC